MADLNPTPFGMTNRVISQSLSLSLSLDMGRTKVGVNTKLYLTVDAHGMPFRAIITADI